MKESERERSRGKIEREQEREKKNEGYDRLGALFLSLLLDFLNTLNNRISLKAYYFPNIINNGTKIASICVTTNLTPN